MGLCVITANSDSVTCKPLPGRTQLAAAKLFVYFCIVRGFEERISSKICILTDLFCLT